MESFGTEFFDDRCFFALSCAASFSSLKAISFFITSISAFIYSFSALNRIRARGEYIPELPMEYVLYRLIDGEVDFINDVTKDGQPYPDVVLSIVQKIPEPDRSIVLNAMKESYESGYDPEDEEYNPDFFIDQYEDMKNYLDICFWDHDCLMLDEIPLEVLKDSPIDQWFDMTGFKDSRHYQEVKTGADGEEMVVDVSLDDYPWNLEK